MRPDLVVVLTPALDHDLRIDSIAKPLHRQALIAELAVEGLVRAVLPWLARIDERRFDVLAREPSQDRAGQELRAVVGSQVPRSSMPADEPGEYLDHAVAADTASDIDRQRLARELRLTPTSEMQDGKCC